MDKKITTIAIIVAIILLAAGLAFVPKEFMEQYGIVIMALPIVVLVVIVGVAVYLNNREERPKKPKAPKISGGKEKMPVSLRAKREEQKKKEKEEKNKKKSLKQFEGDRRKVEEEIKSAEKKYLKHKIDQNTFNSITSNANQRLIRIEAGMDAIKRKDLSGTKMRKMEYVSKDKKVVLENLMKEKTNKVHELKIAERKYLKRKIDEGTYKNITSDINKEIISLDSQIKSIHKASAIDKIKAGLKAGVAEVEKQKALSKKRLEEQLEADILEQLPKR